MSLIEMMVAISLFGAIVGVMGPVMTSAFNSTRVVQNESRALDEIRVAISRIDRELRSAECITSPAAGSAGSVLDFRTHANGSPYDVTYSVVDGQLVRTVGTDTQHVGEGIVVTSEEFGRAANPGQRDAVAIELNVRFEGAHNPRVVSTTIAGRNAWASCP